MAEATKPFSRSKSPWQWLLVMVLACIVAIAALPNYLNSAWPWHTPLQVPHLKQLKAVGQTPLALPGWTAIQHQTVNISRQKWELTEYQLAGATAAPVPSQPESVALLLKPQSAHNKQPEVEWIDISGSQGWRVSDEPPVHFTVPTPEGGTAKITARYFRGINSNGTLAVMQWYAWPQGGHFTPGKWFWADQVRQWQHRERLPWVAVCLLLQIEPVGNIRSHTDTVVAIAQAVQTELWASHASQD
jgi:cyanoexosortase B-associated protein